MDWGTILNLGATYLSSKSAKKAASAQANAAKSAATAVSDSTEKQIEFNKWLNKQQTELQKPYYNTGVSSLPMLQARAGIRPSSAMPKLQKIPRYSADQASKIDNVYDYISNLYIDGLGREGSPADINKWVEKIASGEYDKKSVVDAFMTEAQNTGVQFDTQKLTDIKKALNVQNSLLSTNKQPQNYLATYKGEGVENPPEVTSTMGSTSPFGGISFSAIKDFAKKYGSKAATAIGVVNPLAGLVAVGLSKLASYLPDDKSTGGWGDNTGYSVAEMNTAATQSAASSLADNPQADYGGESGNNDGGGMGGDGEAGGGSGHGGDGGHSNGGDDGSEW